MPAAEVLQPEDIAPESLQALYDQAGLQTEIDADGDLLVTSGISCYVIPTKQRDRILLMAFVGTKEDVDRDPKVEFANRVNNQLSLIRSRVNDSGRVILDYYIPVEGGIAAEAVVSVTRFFLDATAHAVSNCDDDHILR